MKTLMRDIAGRIVTRGDHGESGVETTITKSANMNKARMVATENRASSKQTPFVNRTGSVSSRHVGFL